MLPEGLRTVDEALHRTRFRILPFLGPAFIACVAYIDPGNFATNIAGGSKFGYTLVWVIVVSNLMAMLIQTLSAKLGIATGRTCRRSVATGSRVANVARTVAAGRGNRDGDGPRGVPRRGGRLSPAVRVRPVSVGDHHRHRGLRDPGAAAVRRASARSRDRRDRRRDRRLLPRRADLLESRPRSGRPPRCHPRLQRLGLGVARRRDPRRDRDAARHLSALRADAGSARPRDGPGRAHPASLHAGRRADRDDDRRPDQHGDARDGREHVLRQRPSRRRLARRCASHARSRFSAARRAPCSHSRSLRRGCRAPPSARCRARS